MGNMFPIERRAGEMLRRLEKHNGRPKKNGNSVLPFSELGIGKMQSSRWQKMAGVPTLTPDGRGWQTVGVKSRTRGSLCGGPTKEAVT